MIIENVDLRLFEIEDHINRLAQEREKLRARRQELISIRDRINPVPVVMIG